jgi:hypothetical protein
MNDTRLQTALTVVPVLSVGLYLMGDTYHQAYLKAFGLDDSLFPLATEKALLFGFSALERFGLVPMLSTVLAGFFLLFTVMVALVLSSHPRVKHLQSVVRAKFATSRAKIAPAEAMNDHVDKGATIYGYFAGVFLVFILLVVVAFFSGKSGREQATKEIRSFKDEVGNYAILYSPLLLSPTRAKQIICSQSHCAFWLGSESLVLRHESIERVMMHNSEVEGMLRDTAAQRPSP